MKSLMTLAAVAALMLVALGTSGCGVDWRSSGTVVVRPEPAYDATPWVYRDSYPVAVERCPAPVVYLPPVIVDRGHGNGYGSRSRRCR